MSATFWKELNSRLPSAPEALHEFFKNNDGSAPIPLLEDKRNLITLFVERNKSGKKTKEFIEPSIRKITFNNDNGTLSFGIRKKNFTVNWNGKISCDEKVNDISCSVSGQPFIVDAETPDSPKKGLRYTPKMQKVLKRERQFRETIPLSTIDLWTEGKTNVRDLNELALFGGAGIAATAATAGFFIPAMAILVAASPMLAGAPALANGEALIRNNNGEWYLNSNFKDDKWISEIKVKPANIRSIDILQDDEFYFHARVNLNKPLTCSITEESDTLSTYPNRLMECE